MLSMLYPGGWLWKGWLKVRVDASVAVAAASQLLAAKALVDCQAKEPPVAEQVW